MAVALGTPFISGKDSLNNEFRPAGREPISIPPSLLISALGQVDDVSHCVTMDLKEPGNHLYLVGLTKNELGGSHFATGRRPRRRPGAEGRRATLAKRTFAALHHAIARRPGPACHDLSEGGLAVAAAEMAFAGGLGAEIQLDRVPAAADASDPKCRAASASPTRGSSAKSGRDNAAAFEARFGRHSRCARIGGVVDNGQLEIRGDQTRSYRADLAALKEAWQKPLSW